MGVFKIDASNFEWIAAPGHQQEDLCLHGSVTAIIGSEILTDTGTISATALYLLKTLEKDHTAGVENQMIPCCGHFLIPNEDLSEVEIIGCPYGTDWTVEHIAGAVRIITACGNETVVPMDDYRLEVYAFVDKIEAYYHQCEPKKPADDFEEKGYQAFWNEWNRRRYG